MRGETGDFYEAMTSTLRIVKLDSRLLGVGSGLMNCEAVASTARVLQCNRTAACIVQGGRNDLEDTSSTVVSGLTAQEAV